MPEPPLSDEELRALRIVMEHDARMAWLWAALRRYATLASGAIVGAYATYDAVWKFFFKPKGGG